ncbi:protein of unknown function [Sterolibacterium denitrificans]|uniref:Uncharacterized protein n=2 Tax=Sterolibacterium denitrificans TaxID=157592 RepID=A0A7Z7MV47_9PROT|nr:protein of unknown function [Sterolibacterium denitrificans]
MATEASLLPEAHDPVLGDRATVVEWAWSPQYAKRFGVPVQADGLKDGHLWLLGIKVLRAHDRNMQSYLCRIVGLIDNKAPMLWPPGDRYILHTAYRWLSGLPGSAQRAEDRIWMADAVTSKSFTPGHAAWIRRPKNKREEQLPERSMGASYIFFNRHHTADLAYFELEGACRYFNDPRDYRNELRFPTRIDGVNDEIRGEEALWEPSALRFDIPDRVMLKVWPTVLKAADWSLCLMHRSGMKNLVGIRKDIRERLGSTSCVPVDAK